MLESTFSEFMSESGEAPAATISGRRTVLAGHPLSPNRITKLQIKFAGGTRGRREPRLK